MKVKRRSQKQEKSVAKDLNAKTVVASGAMWNSKGDIRNDKFLIECKTTEKDYYTVKTEVWEKIAQEADRDGMRIPLLVVDLKDHERYVIFNPKDFNKNMPQWLLPGGDTVTKSQRLKGWNEQNGMPIAIIIRAIKGDKVNHVLFAWTIDKFKEYYKEEL